MMSYYNAAGQVVTTNATLWLLWISALFAGFAVGAKVVSLLWLRESRRLSNANH
jgi:hypothetical protein